MAQDEHLDALHRHVLGFRTEMAFHYAFHLHAQQTKKGGHIPYMGHLLGVAALVIDSGGNDDEAAAALLHDAIEDQGAAQEAEINRLFGMEVADIVRRCSDLDSELRVHTAANAAERKRRYVERLPRETLSALRVSLADKLYNVRSILFDCRQDGDRVFDRFNVGKEDTLAYYRTLVTAFRAAPEIAPLEPWVDELDRTVCELERLVGSPRPPHE